MGEAAAALLVPAPRLRRLSLFDNALGDAGAGRLADALAAAAHTSLLELDLAGSGIGPVGVARLFAVLEGGAAPALEARLPAAVLQVGALHCCASSR
jgi:Ran GTPase-activating protein (RanGAP) involved in mRNA processing and transport